MSTNDSEPYDTEDVEAALQALHASLTDDLQELETRIRAVGQTTPVVQAECEREMADYYEARTALHSGLASIAEVLAWIQWKTEEDPEGEVAVALQPLPTLRGCSVH